MRRTARAPLVSAPRLRSLSAITALVLLAAPALPARGEPPVLEVAWPQPAAVGDLVVIRGRGLSPKPGKNVVRFGDAEAPVLEAVAVEGGGFELKVTVPETAGGRGPVPLTVTAGGRTSAPLDFRLRPVVVAAPAPALAPGGTASLTLRVLGSRQPESVEVITIHPGTATLDGRVSRVTTSRIGRRDDGVENLATVRLTAPPAPAAEETRAAGEAAEPPPPRIFSRPLPPAADLSCPETLGWLGEGPQILEVVPATAGPGEPVRLRGRGFGEDAGDLRVSLGGEHVTVLDARPGEILILLPQDAASGPLRVERGGGDAAGRSNDAWVGVVPRLLLAADRLDLMRGQIATVTATLVGTAEATDLTVVITTPQVARLEGDAVSGVVTTGGGEPNRVSFPVRAVREGVFQLLATALLAPEEPARARPTEPRLTVPDMPGPPGAQEPGAAEPGAQAPDVPATGAPGVPAPRLEGLDQAGRRRLLPAGEIEWTPVPESLGTVGEDGRFRPGGEAGCGVLVGRWGETAPVVVPVELWGPVLQQAPGGEDDDCDWRRICVDFYYLARPREGGGFEVTAYEAFEDMLGTNFRPRSVALAAGDFNLAGGALAPLGDKAAAADLIANLRLLLGKLSRIYRPCCIWFDLGEVYAVDPSRARVSRDGTSLDAFLGDGALDVSSRVETADGNLGFLDAAQRFVGTHSGLEANDCLKMFLAPDLEGAGDEAGKGQNGGAFSVVGADRIRPQDSGFVPAHEVGHNLMGEGHWERTDEQGDREFNAMEDTEPSVRHSTGEIFIDEETQCPKVRRRAEAIGTRRDPPAEGEGEDEDGEKEGGGEREGGGEEEAPGEEAPEEGPGEPGSEEPEEGGAGEGTPEDEGDSEEPPETERETCPCDEPRPEVEGLEALRGLRMDAEASATASWTTCCGVVRLTVEMKRKISKFDYAWRLDFEKTREECFESFELDRYYNSRSFRYFVAGGTADMPVQVREVDFEDLGEGRFRLRGDGGFVRDYRGQDLLAEDRLDPDFDNRLDAESDQTSWNLVLGGVVRCKEGEESRAFPFHLIFRKQSGQELRLEAAAGVLPDEDAGGGLARRKLVKSTLYRLPGGGR